MRAHFTRRKSFSANVPALLFICVRRVCAARHSLQKFTQINIFDGNHTTSNWFCLFYSLCVYNELYIPIKCNSKSHKVSVAEWQSGLKYHPQNISYVNGCGLFHAYRTWSETVGRISLHVFSCLVLFNGIGQTHYDSMFGIMCVCVCFNSFVV